MKHWISTIFTGVLLLGTLAAAAGCGSPAVATTKTTPVNTTALSPAVVQLPTIAPADVIKLTLPDQGNIRVDGRGEFNYQRVYKTITEATTWQGVTFTPFTYGPGTTITAPVGYWFTITFADGTSEQLQYVGLGNTDNVDINVTKHNNPAAGVILAWQDVGGGLTPFLYLLVSQ
jgi:hypothetical protein